LALAYSESFFDVDISKLKEKLLKTGNIKLEKKIENIKTFTELLEYLEKNKKEIVK